MPPIDGDDDDTVSTNKIAAKLKAVAKKPCTYLAAFICFWLGFIAGAWLFM